MVPEALSRSRKWTLVKLIHYIISFGSQSLGTEILEYFHFREGFHTVSAFVQQRQKLSAAAMEELFRLFCSWIDSTPTLFKGYRITTVDGSDLSLPYNPKEYNVIGDKHYSTLHLNCLYDVCNRVLLDAVIQHGKKENLACLCGLCVTLRFID